MLTGGNSLSVFGLLLGDIKGSTKSFSNMIRKSVAALLTDLEGEDKRLMTGNISKSSSLRVHDVRPTTNSVKQMRTA